MRDPQLFRMRALAGLNVAAFGGAQVMLVANFAYLAERLGLGLSTMIATFSLGSFLFLFGSPFWSRKSDEWGRLKVLLIGSTGLFLSFSLVAWIAHLPFESVAANWVVLLLSRVVYGFFASSIAPVAQALQSDLDRDVRSSRAMLLHSMGLNLGRVAALALVVSASNDLLGGLLAFAAATGVLIALNAFYLGTETPRDSRPSGASWLTELVHLRGVAAIAFVFAVLAEALNSSLSGNLRAILTIGSSEASAYTARILLFATAGTVAVQALSRRFLKLSGKSSLLIGIAALFVGSALYVSAGTETGIWMALTFFVLGIGLTAPGYLTLVRGDDGSQGRRAGLIASVHTLGYAVGGAVAALALRFGAVQSRYALFALAAVLAGLGLKIVFESAPRTRENVA